MSTLSAMYPTRPPPQHRLRRNALDFWRMAHDHAAIGLGCALVTMIAPETLLTYGEKVLAAVFLAVVSSVVSVLVKQFLNRNNK